MFQKIQFILILTIGLFLATSINNELIAQDIVIVVNNANGIDKMSAGQVKLYYLRKIKKRWPDSNETIKLATYEGNSAAKDAFIKLMGLSEAQLDLYFDQRQFSNSELPPEKVANDAEMVAFVQNNPGAMAYVPYTVYTSNKDKLKVVFQK